MSAETAAGPPGTNRTMTSDIEAGRFGTGEERLRRPVDIHACADRGLVDTPAAG